MLDTFTLRIHRPRTLAYGLRRFRLLVDGVELATLESGATLALSVPHGSRELVAKVDWVKSRPLALAALAQTAEPTVDCLANLHPLDVLKASFGLPSDHIRFVAHDATRPKDDDLGKLSVRAREGVLWVAGCALAAVFLVLILHNLELSPAVEAPLTSAIGLLAALMALAGGWVVLRK
jgi:hypothetical protein